MSENFDFLRFSARFLAAFTPYMVGMLAIVRAIDWLVTLQGVFLTQVVPIAIITIWALFYYFVVVDRLLTLVKKVI